MPGHSLHIGLNWIDPSHYGSDGRLHGCENDARDMKAIAHAMGFHSELLLNDEATASSVSKAIRNAAATLGAGDLFFVSYSGHGGQVPDTNGDEADSRDETWCLYDRQMIDDEMYSLWGLFAPGTRILILSDSCHSGTVAKVLLFEKTHETLAEGYGFRTLPRGVLEETYRRSRDLYDRISFEHQLGNRSPVGASVMLISGCQDWQLSGDGPVNGYFTGVLRNVWSDGGFKGSYLDFHAEIWSRMPDYQKSNYFRTGTPNPAFDNARPFQI